MKILHVYAGNLFGGIETLLVTLTTEQSRHPQMQHNFALCFEGRLTNELRSRGASVRQLGNVRISRPWTVLRARKQLQQLLRQEQIDVVICHACWPQAIFGPVVRANKIPLVFWCHDTPSGQQPLERLAKLVQPDLVIANSRYTQAAVPKLYPKTEIHTLYLPIADRNIGNNTDLSQATRAELNTPDEAVVIIQASRLERWKGQSFLISALGQLREMPGWVCWIAGGVQRPQEELYLEELKMQVQELKIAERVLFLGQRNDVPRLLAAADIHCQPNTGPEPFGIAFIEALYAGLPMVTTAIGAATEIADDSCARLVRANDLDALSAVLGRLITNPKERASLASGGRARADYLCNPQKQMTQLYHLLSHVVKKEAIV